MRIGVLNNLRAGKNDARVTRLLQFLKAYPEVVSVETSATGAVPEALAELASREVDLLAVNGGDGTLAWALGEILGNSAFGDQIPLIAPLRGGRTNMSALDLGSQRDPVKGMAELIKSVRSGRVQERVAMRRVLRVEHGTYRNRDVQYGMFFGAGMIQRAIGMTGVRSGRVNVRTVAPFSMKVRCMCSMSRAIEYALNCRRRTSLVPEKMPWCLRKKECLLSATLAGAKSSGQYKDCNALNYTRQ